MTKRWWAAAAACVILSSDPAAAQQHDRVEWHSSWRPFQWWNYATTAVLLGGALGIGLGTDFQDDGHRGGVLFDEPLREAFRLRTRSGRDAARSIGDRLYHGALIYPHLVDALLVAGIAHERWDVAAQIFLINIQSQSLTAIVSLATEHFIGRARPSSEPCKTDPQYERFCGGGEYDSFISGHTSMAMTSAGLICAHHSKMPLYGGGVPDVAACVTGIVLASSTGVMRMINDRHWPTDVITGAAVGTLSGYVVPMLLHYGFGDGPLAKSTAQVRHLVLPTVSRDRLGFAWAGAF